MGRTSVALLALAMLSACGDDDGSTDGGMDAEVPMDAGDAGRDAGAFRTMNVGPAGSGLPTDNRIFLAEFQPLASFSVYRSSVVGSATDTPLTRHVFAETPFRASALRIPAGSGAGMYVMGVTGEGEHTASVWLGKQASGDLEADRTRLETALVSVVGLKIEEAGAEPVAVDLEPSAELLATSERVWLRYEGSFGAREGAFLMTISAPVSFVHAPVVQHVETSTLSLHRSPARSLTIREHAILERWHRAIRSPRRGHR